MYYPMLILNQAILLMLIKGKLCHKEQSHGYIDFHSFITTVGPPYRWLHFPDSATNGQPCSENIKCKKYEIYKF